MFHHDSNATRPRVPPKPNLQKGNVITPAPSLREARSANRSQGVATAPVAPARREGTVAPLRPLAPQNKAVTCPIADHKNESGVISSIASHKNGPTKCSRCQKKKARISGYCKTCEGKPGTLTTRIQAERIRAKEEISSLSEQAEDELKQYLDNKVIRMQEDKEKALNLVELAGGCRECGQLLTKGHRKWCSHFEKSSPALESCDAISPDSQVSSREDDGVTQESKSLIIAEEVLTDVPVCLEAFLSSTIDEAKPAITSSTECSTTMSVSEMSRVPTIILSDQVEQISQIESTDEPTGCRALNSYLLKIESIQIRLLPDIKISSDQVELPSLQTLAYESIPTGLRALHKYLQKAQDVSLILSTDDPIPVMSSEVISLPDSLESELDVDTGVADIQEKLPASTAKGSTACCGTPDSVGARPGLGTPLQTDTCSLGVTEREVRGEPMEETLQGKTNGLDSSLRTCSESSSSRKAPAQPPSEEELLSAEVRTTPPKSAPSGDEDDATECDECGVNLVSGYNTICTSCLLENINNAVESEDADVTECSKCGVGLVSSDSGCNTCGTESPGLFDTTDDELWVETKQAQRAIKCQDFGRGGKPPRTTQATCDSSEWSSDTEWIDDDGDPGGGDDLVEKVYERDFIRSDWIADHRPSTEMSESSADSAYECIVCHEVTCEKCSQCGHHVFNCDCEVIEECETCGEMSCEKCPVCQHHVFNCDCTDEESYCTSSASDYPRSELSSVGSYYPPTFTINSGSIMGSDSVVSKYNMEWFQAEVDWNDEDVFIGTRKDAQDWVDEHIFELLPSIVVSDRVKIVNLILKKLNTQRYDSQDEYESATSSESASSSEATSSESASSSEATSFESASSSEATSSESSDTGFSSMTTVVGSEGESNNSGNSAHSELIQGDDAHTVSDRDALQKKRNKKKFQRARAKARKRERELTSVMPESDTYESENSSESDWIACTTAAESVDSQSEPWDSFETDAEDNSWDSSLEKSSDSGYQHSNTTYLSNRERREAKKKRNRPASSFSSQSRVSASGERWLTWSDAMSSSVSAAGEYARRSLPGYAQHEGWRRGWSCTYCDNREFSRVCGRCGRNFLGVKER